MSDNAETTLVDIQLDAQGRALADAYLSDVTVLSDRKGDLQTEIAKSLGLLTVREGKLGLCVVVNQLIADDAAPNAPGGPMGVQLVFTVLENPLLNLGDTGTKKHSAAVARRLARIFKNYTHHGLHAGFVKEKPCIVPVQSDAAPVAYEVRFNTREADMRNVPHLEVEPVLITISGETGYALRAVAGEVTLNCPTAGATIYYTTNGTHPRNGNGTVYAGPFNFPAGGGTLKAVAYKAGYIASDLSMAILSASGGGEGFVDPGSGEFFRDPATGEIFRNP